jgi:hypothetical protein
MHNFKNFDRMLKEATKRGFRVEHKNAKVMVFHPDKEKGFRLFHPDEKGYHHLRRFINK